MSSWQKLAAVDVGYPTEGGAIAALVMASDRGFGNITAEHVVRVSAVEPYRPGAFTYESCPRCRRCWLSVARST